MKMITFELVYNVKENEDKIRIMTNNFVKKYNKKLKIIYKNKMSNLSEFISISSKTKKIVKIKLIFHRIINFSEVTAGCESVYKIYNIGNNFEFTRYNIIKLYYNIKPSSTEIKIFGENFVKNNIDKCFIICENIIYPLKSYFCINDIGKESYSSKKLEISLIISKEILDKSYMFHNCPNLEKIEIQYEKYAKVKYLNEKDSNNLLIKKILDEVNFDTIKKENEILNFYDDYEFEANENSIDINDDIYNSLNSSIISEFLSNVEDSFEKYPQLNLDKYKFSSRDNSYPLLSSNLDVNLTSNLSHSFDGCISLISPPDLFQWNTCNVIDMSYMFNNCYSLKSIPDISNWNTEKVKDISYMFCRCSSLISLPDISKWNTKSIINISNTFYGCISLFELPDISKWNTDKITNISYLFFECSSLLSIPDISKWNTNNVIDMSFMFSFCSSLISLPDISKWDTNKVINFSFMFSFCSLLDNLPDISKWKTDNVIDMSFMFYGCSCLKSLPCINKWDTHKAKNVSYMFNECPSLKSTPNINKYNSLYLTDTDFIINDCKSIKLFYKNNESDNKIKIFGKIFVFNNRGNYMILFNNKLLPLQVFFPTPLIEEKQNSIEISFIKLDDINYKEYMKYLCYKKEELNLKKYENQNLTKNIEDEEESKKYENFYQENEIINLDENTITEKKSELSKKATIIEECQLIESLVNKKNKEIKNCKNMSYMFYKCFSLLAANNMSEFNTQDVTDMSYMFFKCSSLIFLSDISNWKTDNVSNMSNMFNECTSLKFLPDISKWNISNVKDISYIFCRCSSLASIPDISKWDINNVYKMDSLLEECSSLISLPNLSKWKVENKNVANIFKGCIQLSSLPKLSKWNNNFFYYISENSFLILNFPLQDYKKISLFN